MEEVPGEIEDLELTWSVLVTAQMDGALEGHAPSGRRERHAASLVEIHRLPAQDRLAVLRRLEQHEAVVFLLTAFDDEIHEASLCVERAVRVGGVPQRDPALGERRQRDDLELPVVAVLVADHQRAAQALEKLRGLWAVDRRIRLAGRLQELVRHARDERPGAREEEDRHDEADPDRLPPGDRHLTLR
ncbi:MAG: hypothetical protein AB1726_16740 [Planctomycetota bacterium]